MKSLNQKINDGIQAKKNSPIKEVVTPDIEQKIINFFITEKNNSVSRISRELNVPAYNVSRAINKYLKEKRKKL